MRSLVFCYAPQDAEAAREIGRHLEANCDVTVSYEEGRIRPGGGLVEATEAGLSADVAVVLFSPASIPDRWVREKWEPVFCGAPRELGTEIAFVLLGSCKFPDVLRRGNFFDLSHGGPVGNRDLKRWLLSLDRLNRAFQSPLDLPELPRDAEVPHGALDDLECRLADKPGSETGLRPDLALAFAHVSRDDFEGVFWIDCANRGRAGVIGDTAQALGLRLSGTLEENQAALKPFCETRRCLFVFSNVEPADRELVSFAGRSSVIFTADAPPRLLPRPEDTVALFSAWVRNSDECLKALGDAESVLRHLIAQGPEGWPPALQLGSAMAALLRNQERLAEAHDVLETLADAASDNGDVLTLHRLAWEQGWIREQWGQPAPVRSLPRPEEPAQLGLFGAA